MDKKLLIKKYNQTGEIKIKMIYLLGAKKISISIY